MKVQKFLNLKLKGQKGLKHHWIKSEPPYVAYSQGNVSTGQFVEASDRTGQFVEASDQEDNSVPGSDRSQLFHCLDNDSFSSVTPSYNIISDVPHSIAEDVNDLHKKREVKELLNILNITGKQNMRVDLDAYISRLQLCIDTQALAEGKCIYAHLLKSGFKPSIYLGNALANMYAKSGTMFDACSIFNMMPERNVFTWTILIGGFVHNGQSKEALELFNQMLKQGVKPDKVTFINVLKACTTISSVEQGKQIHALIIRNKFESDVFIGSSLIDMYAKCRNIEHAHRVFEKMHMRDVVAWNAIISGYAQQGEGEKALQLFEQMEREGLKPNAVTFVSILKACTSLAALERGKQIHAHIIRSGFDSNLFVANTLINMYAKCGSTNHARRVFNLMNKRSLVSWNVMMVGYGSQGQVQEALELFWQMESDGVKPDWVTFASMLKACAIVAALDLGKQIHAIIIKNGRQSDVCVSNALVNMYAKCGSIECACQVFNEMPKRNVVSWNAMIVGYTQHGQGEKATELFLHLQQEGIEPNKITFISILKACASVAALEQGKQIHVKIIACGLDSNLCVCNALIDMYGKCGSVDLARQVFDNTHSPDVVTWNAMIAGYVEHGQFLDAFRLFWQMEHEDVKQNEVTFVSILKACISIQSLELGRQIHAQIIKSGLELSAFAGSAIVDMYAKCGDIRKARKVFDKMPKRDVVSWTAMIAGYAQHDQGEEALELFRQMKWEEKPDKVTFVSMLKACASVAALEEGKQIHAQISKAGFESDAFVGNALLDMYTKCGSIEHAQKLFENMPKRDMVSWNAIITGYAQHGQGKRVLELFEQMQQEGIKPDQVTFVSILSACSYAGLVDEGCKCFGAMCQFHDISPIDEHYTCLVDLFGRSGYLDDADDFIKRMPMQPSSSLWTILLGACRMSGKMELANLVSQCLFKMDRHSATSLLLISDVYAAVGRWNNKAEMRKLLENKH